MNTLRIQHIIVDRLIRYATAKGDNGIRCFDQLNRYVNERVNDMNVYEEEGLTLLQNHVVLFQCIVLCFCVDCNVKAAAASASASAYMCISMYQSSSYVYI